MASGLLSEESPAVLTHLQILQGIIDRMASNSVSCKTWCATLVAAMLVLSFIQNIDLSPLVALIPVGVLAYQDATYLTLERDLRRSYNEFVQKLHGGIAASHDLFVVSPQAPPGERLKTATSWSVCLFYVPLAAAAIGLHFV